MTYVLMHAETRSALLEDLDLVRTRLNEARWWLNEPVSHRERLIAINHLEQAQERLLAIAELLSHLPA